MKLYLQLHKKTKVRSNSQHFWILHHTWISQSIKLDQQLLFCRGIMWKLSCFWCTMEAEQGLLLSWTRFWYHVKFVNHWYTRKHESCRKGIMQWNNKIKCTLNRKLMPQISDKLVKNFSDNHNINLHSLINNTMIIQ